MSIVALQILQAFHLKNIAEDSLRLQKAEQDKKKEA